jgi:L-ascorbate metabolism protein UlaG (beta-lactamase superfamily)
MKASLTLVGGPTALIEIDGLRLLTDPTFDPAGEEYRPGPYVLKKVAGPALSAEDVGFVDAVLLSHDHHFDNLDRAGRALAEAAPLVITTTVGADRMAGRIRGLDPWQHVDLPTASGRTLRITATPAQHGPADHERGPVIGFLLAFVDAPEHAIYLSGDTVWFEGAADIATRYHVEAAVLFMGAARVLEVGPWPLTFTAEDGIIAARAFPAATIVPVHADGWAHYSETRPVITQAFRDAGLEDRLRWPVPGQAITLLA